MRAACRRHSQLQHLPRPRERSDSGSHLPRLRWCSCELAHCLVRESRRRAAGVAVSELTAASSSTAEAAFDCRQIRCRHCTASTRQLQHLLPRPRNIDRSDSESRLPPSQPAPLVLRVSAPARRQSRASELTTAAARTTEPPMRRQREPPAAVTASSSIAEAAR